MARRSSISYQEIALCMFERPTEPIFVPKGQKNIVYDVPTEYLAERYRPLASSLINRFSQGDVTKVQVTSVQLPDMTEMKKLPRRGNFSLFIPYHANLAKRLINLLMGFTNTDDFFCVSAYCRDCLNPYLFVYAFSVALLHRPDTRKIEIPPLSEIFPASFLDGAVFLDAREQANILADETTRLPIEIPMDFTASDREIEHRVAYFREDLGVNLHHWHWHLVYPYDGPREVVIKDRRGELFYYMHQQIMARYEVERMCNRLPRVKRLTNLFEPIEEGYFSKLDTVVASRVWMPRAAGAKLKDIDRESAPDQVKFDLDDLVQWKNRILEAISLGRVQLPDGSSLPLDEIRGIDILGNMIEPSPMLSPNHSYYGNLHNFGHVAIGLSHDPDNRHLENYGVMGDTATAMRDPVFYRWHGFINGVFMQHKDRLPRYTLAQLEYPAVRVHAVEVVNQGNQGNNSERNVLHTFWQKSDIDVSRGLDFTPPGTLYARHTHLQHVAFQYRITVENLSNSTLKGTMRIFLAPKFDERGEPWLLREQRNVFIELDRFTVSLKGTPRTTIISRNSSQSSVTIPFERTFRDLELGLPADNQLGPLGQFNFCGCGWPQHMLIPKGTPEGFPCQLFVMLSDYNDDRVEQMSREPGVCSDSMSYCGVRDQLYPDRRSMGYPFDRLPHTGVNTLYDFLTPNMTVADVMIRFSDRVVAPKTPANDLLTNMHN